MRFGKFLEPQYRVVLFIISLLWSSLGSCQGLADLFQLFPADSGGGCPGREAVFEQWIVDARELARTIDPRNVDCSGNPIFQGFIASWFGAHTEDGNCENMENELVYGRVSGR
jgi:hypothetical protein